MSRIIYSLPTWQMAGLTVVRMIVGIFMIYHRREIFMADKIHEYLQWDMFKGSSGKLLVYLGKGSELVAGLLLCLGLFTRVASVIIIATMCYISFFVGTGKVWMEDQHPFLFVLLAFVFLCIGAGKWSLDYFLFNKSKRYA